MKINRRDLFKVFGITSLFPDQVFANVTKANSLSIFNYSNSVHAHSIFENFKNFSNFRKVKKKVVNQLELLLSS